MLLSMNLSYLYSHPFLNLIDLALLNFPAPFQENLQKDQFDNQFPISIISLPRSFAFFVKYISIPKFRSKSTFFGPIKK